MFADLAEETVFNRIPFRSARGVMAHSEISLAYTPEANIGDYVIVHVGFALDIVDEDEAHRGFDYVREIGELEELRS